jgi:mediator of RNA polymerase II transcription subunit 13
VESEPVNDDWFTAIGDCPNSELLRLYSKVCHHYLVPLLATIPLDNSLLRREQPSSTMGPPETLQEKVENGDGGLADREATDAIAGEEGPGEPPAIVIYIVDPFSFGVDNPELMRLSSIALLRCFTNMVADTRLRSDSLRQSLYLQTISLESIYSVTGETRREAASNLSSPGSTSGSRATSLLRDLCMSVYTQSQRPLAFNTSTKTLTGFGPASSAERYLKGIEQKPELVKHLYTPPFVLALPSQKNKKTSDAEEAQRSTVLFVTYCLSDDQRHLLASLADDRGEMVRTTVINIHIPNRNRRKKASARRVGLKRLLDWILSVMALSLVPWRLVIGRLGRIGHGELRGWSALLSRKSLKKAVKQLKDQCTWKSDLPTILSVCLISMEPDTVLRVMHEQFTPDERFGGNAATCTLSTPKDATATHILVFPTSATAQSAVQAAFNDHQTGDNGENDFGLGFDVNDMDINPNENDELGLGDLNDIFNDDPFSNAGAASPSGADPGQEEEEEGDSQLPGGDPAFRYGQEVPGERLEILQQPLALGYLASTAATGPMPRWFWASAPHLESVCPVFLKSALHINIANLAHGGDDGLGPGPGQSRHSLDSNYTTDVLRYVLEGYNALSWLVLDPVTHDRQSCLPIHVQTLLQLYHAMAAIV